MILLRQILCLVAVSVFPAAPIGADEMEDVGDTLALPTDQITSSLRQTAMPELSEGRLARTLTRYYHEALGGPDQWDGISSLKMSGSLKLEQGEFELMILKKKPVSLKMTFRNNEREFVLGYDGETAWRTTHHAEGTETELMGETETRIFIHKAMFSDYLTYPLASGKKIEYVETASVEGNACHHVRVTLDNDYQVDYFLDLVSFLAVQIINTDLRTGSTERNVYKNYDRESGMPVARHIESFEDGEWVSTTIFNKIKVNAGLVPWMFEKPR